MASCPVPQKFSLSVLLSSSLTVKQNNFQLMNETEYHLKNYGDLSEIFIILHENSSCISIVHVYREAQEIKGCSGLQIYSKQQTSSVELSSCCSCYVFRQQFTVKRVKCSAILYSLPNKLQLVRGILSYRSIIYQFCCKIDVVSSISQNYFKFGQLEQLVMMNYAWDFNQSETEKYSE